ncbi:MAG: hypothetical protein ACR2JJ_02080 [Sphingomicrobium sp.]
MEEIALRVEWLARLAEAIESAQRVAWQLRTCEGASTEARELYSKLEAVRLELESLRGIATRPSEAIDRDLLEKLGWISSRSDPSD